MNENREIKKLKLQTKPIFHADKKMDLATSGLLGNYDNLEIDSIKLCFNFPNEPKTKPSVKGHWIVILSLADQIKYLVTLRELGLFFFLFFLVERK